MLLPPDSIGEDIMFSGRPSATFIRFFFRIDLTMISREQLESH